LVDKEAPRHNEHSTRLSRRVYRAADLHVGRSIQRLVLIGLLFAVLFSSSLPFVANPVVLLPLWGAWQASSLLYRRAAQSPVGFTNWISSDLRLLTTDLHVAARALPGRPLLNHLVDPSPGQLTRKVLLVGLQVTLTGSLAVFGMGIVRPSHGDFATLAALSISAWLWVMTLQARGGLKLRQRRQNFRTSDELKVLASASSLGIVGVSPFGLDVISSKPLKTGQNMRIAFALPQVDGSSIRFECPTAVRRVSRDGNRNFSYLRFAILSDREVDQITEYCAVVAGVHELRDAPSVGAEPMVPIPGTIVQPRAQGNLVAEV
jgi:hypothetical protein